MSKYTFVCQQGHEPETISVEAETDDEALEKMLPMCKAHLGEKHAEMAGQSDDEIKQMISSGWTKEDGGGEAPAEPMAGGM